MFVMITSGPRRDAGEPSQSQLRSGCRSCDTPQLPAHPDDRRFTTQAAAAHLPLLRRGAVRTAIGPANSAHLLEATAFAAA
jgi:hypothetical protein